MAPQERFRTSWLPGITHLGLEWLELMETGFDITPDNRAAVIAELARLRAWMAGYLSSLYELERLDGLVAELRALRLEDGGTAFLG